MERNNARATTARVAGSTILLYIATSIIGNVVFTRSTRGDGTVARLASIVNHGPQMRLSFVLALLTIFEALILAVALYELTRDEDAKLALFALACRVVEGVLNAIPAVAMLALLSIALQLNTAAGSNAAALAVVGRFLFELQGWTVTVSAPIFGVGSALFYYLLLRARSIPISLGWFGVASSALLVVAMPLEGLHIIYGPMASYVWLPSLLFELIFAPWLLIKGVAARGAT